MKKAIICFVLALCCRTPANALDLSAHSAVLLDGSTGQILYEKLPNEKSLIASTTKIMTALVVLEHADISEVVEIPPEAVGIEGSSMYLRTGEILTVEELLHGLMLSSGNDAAVALALHVSGSVEEFVVLMNEKAASLGLKNTSYANPHGLDSENNFSTARELGLLAAHAMEREDFRKIVSTKNYHCGDRVLTNHNKLLWRYEGALGVKTGFTKKAGRILVGAAERNGRRLISVTINAPNDWQDHEIMFDFGFEQYTSQTIVSEEEILGSVPIIGGEADSVSLVTAESLSFSVLPGEERKITVHIPSFVYAPVEKGLSVGTAEVFMAGQRIGVLELIAADSIPQSPEEPGIWDKILDHLGV